MIETRIDANVDIFFCYREAGSETAKYYKSYLKNHQTKHYGRVWYSDDESQGNFFFDIKKVMSTVHTVILFLTENFTRGFLTDKGEINIDGYVDVNGIQYGGCVTVLEMIEIEKERQKRDIKVIAVNIDNYHFTQEDLEILERVFTLSNILREDSLRFYRDLNRNNYSKRQTDFNAFSERISRGLEKRETIDKNINDDKPKSSLFTRFFGTRQDKKLQIIDEVTYKSRFQEYLKSSKYQTVKIFGYTGEVVSNDLITYLDRYRDNVQIYMLHRNPFIEEVDENKHNKAIENMGLRKWDKAEAIKMMALEKWNYALKREIRYYSHQPILKGSIFCDVTGKAYIGFINFQKWVPIPQEGGSQFKSVPSDMLFISGIGDKKNLEFLERINSQFDYEWSYGITQEEMVKKIKESKDAL